MKKSNTISSKARNSSDIFAGERRIKTFVRTSSGRKVVKYQYVSEDVYNEMIELNKAGARASDSAKRRLKQKLAQSMGLSVS